MIKKTILLFALLALATFSGLHLLQKDDNKLGAIPWDFKNCGSENDPMVITGVVLDGVPEKQITDTISIIGVSNVHGSLSQVKIDVQLSGVKITTLVQNFVQTVDPGDMWIFKYGSFIPGIAPSGIYTISFNFVNNKQVSQACSSITMSL